MELRFVLENTEETVKKARKMFDDREWIGCEFMLASLSDLLTGTLSEGVLETPNMDVKPEKLE